MIEVLILYDSHNWDHKRSLLFEMINDAGGTPKTVEAGEGSYPIETFFARLARTADVILVDLTRPNTNVGYEIGRHLKCKDDRLLFFTFGEKIPFYLAQHYYFQLDKVASASAKGQSQRQNLIAQIQRVGQRVSKAPLQRYDSNPESDNQASALFAHCEKLYRAPAAAFLFGEFAVTVGHPTLQIPLPRYVYVGITELPQSKATVVRYVPEGAQTINKKDLLSDEYAATVDSALRMLGSPPLDILVWSQVPTMCGLGTSSALAACVALHILNQANAGDIFPSPRTYETVNFLKQSSELDRLFKLAWKIDAAFHSYLGSGAGVFASLVGTKSANPLVYFSEARRTWEGDSGRFPWDLGNCSDTTKRVAVANERIDRLRCFGFPLTSGAGAINRGHFALVYTGHPKSTGKAMANVSTMSGYLADHTRMIHGLLSTAPLDTATLRYPLSQRYTDYYKQIVANTLATNGADKEALSQQYGALVETLFSAYGSCCLGGINSFWASKSDSFLALMASCQSILEALGATQVQALNAKGVTHEPTQIAEALNAHVDEDGKRMFGAKITGGGKGGDIIVASRIDVGNRFERSLRDALDDARGRIQTEYADIGRIHFSSSWITGYPEHYIAEPAQRIARR